MNKRNSTGLYFAWCFGVLVSGIAVLTTHAIFSPDRGAWVAWFGLACVVGGTALAAKLRQSMEARSSAAVAVAQRLAAGDLTAFPGGNVADELSAALGCVNGKIFGIIAAVRAGTASIASTSGLTTSDSAALAARTDAQAASLEETASAMEELAATVRQNADNARQASARMAAAQESAVHGRRVVQDVVQNMAGIKQRSAQVADIVSLIDGIAFQTNILALNAAVEAARAGEEGRGFAVVAGEVRALAQRCALAARDIKGLIDGSVAQVDAGDALVADAGRAMDDIVANVGEVAGIMSDIAAATAEQSAGIEEINKSVVHIDGMTQQNAALVQELARTAEMLRDEAEQLAGVALDFRLGEREFGSAEEAVAMVRDAVEFSRVAGTEALVTEVRKLARGRFIDRDLYLSVYHAEGRVAAHGASRRFWDIAWTGFKDADGRLFLAEMMAEANVRGSGWIDYQWVHPMSKETLLKSAYFEKCGDVVIACGVYKQRASSPERGPMLRRSLQRTRLLPT